MSANFSVLIFTKFKNQILSTANDEAFKKVGSSHFLCWSFLHALRIIVSNNKRFSDCFFIVYMSICTEKKNQNRTCIFLLEIPVIEQSRGLIG